MTELQRTFNGRVCGSSLLRRGVLAAIALTFILPSLPATDPPFAEDLSSTIEAARSHWNVPGVSVAVVHQGHVVLSRGFGKISVTSQDQVDGQTLFAIASNTKAFTAAAVAMLADEEHLRWDDRVQQHLPWLKLNEDWISQELRIDDLLCHRSGLATFSGDLLWWGTPYNPKQVLRRIRHLPVKNRFRAEFGYSNLMFLAAGEVIHGISGQSWSEFIQQRILDPLQMDRTVTSVRQLDRLQNVAVPHRTELDGNRSLEWVEWDTMAAAGGLISCSDDMAKWLLLQLNRGQLPDGQQLFSAETAHRMWTPHTVIPVSQAAMRKTPETHFRSCGLGWMLSDYAGRQVVGHGGGYDGMYSRVMLIPEEQLGIVVLTNSMTGFSSSLATAIADEYLGLDSGDWVVSERERDVKNRREFFQRIESAVEVPEQRAEPPFDQQLAVGDYRCPLYGDAEIVLEEDKLVLRLLPNPDLVADLQYLQGNKWRIHWRKQFAWFGDGTVEMIRNNADSVSSLKLDVPNDDLWFDELQLQRLETSRH